MWTQSLKAKHLCFSPPCVKSINNSHLACTAASRHRCMKNVISLCAYRPLSIKGLLCKQVKQLDPGSHCLRLQRQAGRDVEVRHVAHGELLRDVVRATSLRRSSLYHLFFFLLRIDLFHFALQVADQLEVVPANVFTLHMRRTGDIADFGEWGAQGWEVLYAIFNCW